MFTSPCLRLSQTTKIVDGRRATALRRSQGLQDLSSKPAMQPHGVCLPPQGRPRQGKAPQPAAAAEYHVAAPATGGSARPPAQGWGATQEAGSGAAYARQLGGVRGNRRDAVSASIGVRRMESLPGSPAKPSLHARSAKPSAKAPGTLRNPEVQPSCGNALRPEACRGPQGRATCAMLCIRLRSRLVAAGGPGPHLPYVLI